ncbi:MAG: hypothetical protein IPL16_01190 [Ignavibacteria bacterium]|nr:hypothetical protein [Ignavibacteria bacterium]
MKYSSIREERSSEPNMKAGWLEQIAALNKKKEEAAKGSSDSEKNEGRSG